MEPKSIIKSKTLAFAAGQALAGILLMSGGQAYLDSHPNVAGYAMIFSSFIFAFLRAITNSPLKLK